MATNLSERLPVQELRALATQTEACSSGVSWAAIAAGAFVTGALSLILLALGSGASLSSLSPWSGSGLSSSTVKIGALLWLTLSEIISCSVGGYLAGRLRTKWVNLHTDEVYFRDTAHGFLVWAVSLTLTAAFLTSATATMVGSESARNNSRAAETTENPSRYFIDTLFRSAQPAAADAPVRAEIAAIFTHDLVARQLSDTDRSYVAEVVAAKTGISQTEAQKRVSQTFEQNQEALDAARKATAHLLYWLFVALLLGAFCASVAATLGGKQRDRMHV